MTIPDTELETRTETVENIYVEFNGEEFDVFHVFEFLEQIQGTDGFIATFRWEKKFDDLADALIAEDVVKKTVKGSWYEHEDRCEKLYRELEDKYFTEKESDK